MAIFIIYAVCGESGSDKSVIVMNLDYAIETDLILFIFCRPHDFVIDTWASCVEFEGNCYI